MSIEDISSSNPGPRNGTALTPARREGKDVVPSIKHMDDGVFKSTASITRDIMDALAEDFQQLALECSKFKDIPFSNPTPGNVATLTRARREGKDVIPSIKRQFGYVIYSKRHAQDLQKEVEELADEVDRVHYLAEEARNNLRIVYGRVTEWHASAEKALKEAQDLLGDFQEASKTCCYETLPDPKCRYQFSRKAKDKIEVIQRLTQRSSGFKELNDISSSNPALTPAKDNDVFESRASIIRDIMDALADDSNSMVGVYGMGGVGKSTLLADVERRIIEKKSFDWVTKADVSENPDIKKIQEEIAHALGLTEIKNKESIHGRADLLHKRLQNEEREKKKVLIILDNLWEGLDLVLVGIPCGYDNKVIGCKLLLTSRFQDVLRREMSCDSYFRLKELKEEEARRLFERTVGDKVHDDPFKSLVDEAIHKCAGLPFLIIAMANIFKEADFSEWEDVLRQIEMSTNEGISESINKMLQMSYDRFKGVFGEELKSLLRLCVVYDVSKPSLENLVRYSVGSRLFQEVDSMNDARNRMNSHVRTLKASSLLLEDDEDVDGFKINDLVRRFVASVASRDDPFLVLKDNDKLVTELPKDKLKSYTAICFPYVDMKELPKVLDCPEMRIFLLFTNNRSLKVPDSYFNSLKKLMVLHLSQVCLTCSPLPFQFLKNLQTLCLDGCSLEDVAMIGKLKGLHILSFMNSKIQRLPKEIGQLVELRLLDLNHCSQLEIIEPGVLGSLMKLEELYMENSFDRWNAVGQTPPTNASLIELNNMKNLDTLHLYILDPSVLSEDLNVEKLAKYKIHIGDVRLWQSHKGLRTLAIKLDPTSNILQKRYIQTFLSKTDDLYLDGSNGIDQSICALSQEGFSKLKHLHVKNSPSIHYVLQSPSHTDFKRLESLILDNLINLEKICNNHISTKSFSALKVVRVESCNEMVVLFPLSLLRELPQLEKVRTVNCRLMREIVEVDDCGKIELRNLRALELCDLPNMRNFLTAEMAPSSSTSNNHVGTQVVFFNGQQVTFPLLETLLISGMDNMKMIWDNQLFANSFRNLKSLCVFHCNKVVNIIPSFILPQLWSLESLEVQYCDSLKVVFELQPLSPRFMLKELVLLGLPRLKRIWDKELSRESKFQCLHSVSISGCMRLTSLFPASVARDLIQLEELKIDNCGIVVLFEEDRLEEHSMNVEAIGGPSHEQTLILPFSRCFRHLKTLDVSNCNGLSNMLTPTIAENLVELTKLRIRNCKMLTEVISDEDCKKGDVLAFNQLKSMELDGLTWLRCFSSGEYTLRFPLLEDAIVTRCPNMKFFFEGSIEAPKLEKVQVSTTAWSWKGNLDITIQNMYKEMGTDAEVKFMRLFDLPEQIRQWPDELSSKLESFVVDKCSVINASQSIMMLALHNIRSLQVRDCELEEMFDLKWLEGQKSTQVLPQLWHLGLVNLPCLTQLWNKNFQRSLCLNSLSHLTLYKCNNLRHAFAPSMIRCLATLEYMEIKECVHMEGVIEEVEKHGSAVEKITFSNLWWMELEYLPRLASFLLGKNYMLECPDLKWLTIAHCPMMRSFSEQSSMEIDHGTCSLFTPQVALPTLETLLITQMDNIGMIWDNQVHFQHLKTLKVSHCNWLSYMFSPPIAENLVEPAKLRINNCKMLTEVISDEEGKECEGASNQWKDMELDCSTGLRCLAQKEEQESAMKTIRFPNLLQVELECLPKLNSFFSGNNHTLEWPLLKELTISHCPKMTRIGTLFHIHPSIISRLCTDM